MLHSDLQQDHKPAQSNLVEQAPGPEVQASAMPGAPAAGFSQDSASPAVAAQVSHWAEAGDGRQWPEADGVTPVAGAGQKPLGPLQDPTQNPDPKNEFAPTASYGEVKGQVAVKGAGDSHEIAPNDVEQGSIGDCYFVAQLAAQAHTNPDRIKHLIKDNGDGTYTVTLHLRKGGKRAPTAIVVDSQFPQKDGSVAYAKPGDKNDQGPELWAMLIEKAFAKATGSYEQIRGSKTPDGDVFGMMSGIASTSMRLASTNKEQLTKTLTKAVTAGQPVAFGARNKSAGDEFVAEMKTEGVVANHAYSLMSIDAQAGTVNLRNPWGVKHLEGFPIDKLLKYYDSCDIGAK